MQYFSFKTLLHRPLYGFLMLIYVFNFKLFPHFKSARWLQPAIPLLSLVDRLNHAPTCIFAPRKELLLPWSSLLVRCFHGPENPFCFFFVFLLILYFITLIVNYERVEFHSDRRGRRGAKGQSVVSGGAAVKLAASLGVFRVDKHGQMAIIYGMCQFM